MSLEESSNDLIVCIKKTLNYRTITDITLLDKLVTAEEKFDLVLVDLNEFFIHSRIEPRQQSKRQGLANVSNITAKIEEGQLIEFKESLIDIINYVRLLLGNQGFLAVIVNGSIKAPVKAILDKIFRIRNFVNEIVIDYPLKVYYGTSQESFDRTNYILLYSKDFNTKINAVLNNKQSGGYWHSFVSKGQGKPKRFIFKGKEVLLTPPLGTHWKLKQETILKMCKEGRIRLNRKGNPEYWVTSKKGQIIDTNWLDIDGVKLIDQQLVVSKECLDRLFKLCLVTNKRILAIVSNSRELKSLAQSRQLKFLELSLDSDFKSTRMNTGELNHLVRNINKGNAREEDRQDKVNVNFDSKLLDIENYCQKPSESNENYNILIKGDNLAVFPCLADNFLGKFKLVYIDPPFLTGIHENIVVPLKSELQGLTYAISDQAYENVSLVDDQIKFFESWFRERVKWIKKMLRKDGLLFVRFDYHFGHYAKMILDQIFGPENFINEFIVRRMKKNLSRKNLDRQQHLIVHYDSLFAYRASEKARLHLEGLVKVTRKNQDKAELEYNNDNIWVDIAGYEKVKKTLYPTENSEALLRRVVKISTDKGDLVGDFFAGSGTTLIIAEELNRKWVGIDIGIRSVHEIKKRILRRENFSPFEYKEIFRNKTNESFFIPVEKVEYLPENKYRVLLEEKNLDLWISIKATVDLSNSILSVELEDICSSTESDEKKYDFPVAELVDYWGIDWKCKDNLLNITWSSIRKLKGRSVIENVTLEASHNILNDFHQRSIGVLIVDIYGVSFRAKINIPPTKN
ncbi:MAG: DNA methyltransferase [Candidatus Hodarchaeales archaeon]